MTESSFRGLSFLCALFVVVVVALVCIAFPCVSLAQTELAGVSGRITDASGAVIADAEVEIKNVETNVSTTVRTNQDGLYTIPSLHPGHYLINVRKTGFRSVTVTELTLNVQDNVVRNFALQIGSVSETVTITADQLNINTTDASVSTVIDRKFVESLPLNGRSFNTLIQLTPGALIAPASGSAQYSISGQRTDANSFQVDGVSVNFGVANGANLGSSGNGGAPAFNAFGGTSSLVSVDAMQEFRVQTSSFAPEYGRTPGGQISIATRSGTNEYHGGIFDYFRNTVLDANDWFLNSVGSPRAPERQNDFGGFFGGPAVGNTTFFFFSYEGLRLDQPQAKVFAVPSVSLRASAVPSAAPYLNAYPLPNGPISADGNTAQFVPNSSSRIQSDSVSLRVDHTFGGRAQLFGRYNYAPSSLLLSFLPSNPDKQEYGTQTATVGFNFQVTPKLFSSTRINYSLQHIIDSAPLNSAGGALPPPASELIPQPFTTANSFAIFFPLDVAGLEFGNLSSNKNRQFSLVQDVSFSVKSHQLKWGIDYNTLLLHQIGAAINPTSEILSINTFAETGDAFLSILSTTHPGGMLFRFLSAYFQDTWKVSRRLSLTYGSRWEFNPAPGGRDGTTLAAWENVETPSAITLAQPGTEVWKNTYGNFAPRLGIAYSLSRSGDFVLRGGWGMFYDLGTGVAPSLLSFFPNTANQISFNQPLPIINPILPPFSVAPPYNSSTIAGFANDLKLPFSYQWNVAIEKSFGGNQAVSITYVGQSGQRLLRQELAMQPNANFFPGTVFNGTLNGDSSNYQALELQYKRPLWRRLQALLNYTFSHCIDTNSGDDIGVNLQTITPVVNDRGPCDFDVRHNFSGAVLYQLPSTTRNAFLAQLTGGWTVDSIVQARTAFPINVFTSSPIIPGAQTSRPDLVPGQPIWLYGSNYPGGKILNPNAFVIPAEAVQGNLGRNAIPGFGLTQVDFSVHRDFTIRDTLKLAFQTDIFNIFNHPNFTNPNGDLSSPTFGQSTQMLNSGLGGLSSLYQIGGPRSVQFSLRLTF